MEKKIHYCWFGGNKLPKSVRRCIQSWKKYLPDYQIIEWNETNFDINSCPFVKEAYANKKWAFVSDYVRIYALYKEGGIYFDTDMKILKDVRHIIDRDMFLGYEDSGFVGTAVIGVKEKNNAYVKEILDFYNKIEHFNPDIMYNYANPVIITRILKKYESYEDKDGVRIFDNSISVFPREYFYPLSYNYEEREYTDNTCMVHLFNATWTSKGERRTINVYRKFGPDLGKIINKRIDRIFNIKYQFVKKIKSIVFNAKMKYSIYVNRNKRINNIKEELKNKKEDYIVICNPEYRNENKTIENMNKENILQIREQYTTTEAKLIAKSIFEANKKIVIFNYYSYGWDKIIQELKRLERKIVIKVLIHGGNTNLSDDLKFDIFNEILNLYDKGKINVLGIFNTELYELLKVKGYNVELLNECMDIRDENAHVNKNKKSYLKIGIYPQDYSACQNIYNQLAAVSLLEDAKLDCGFCNYQISTMARKFNINLSGNSNNPSTQELYRRIEDNDVTLCITYSDDGSTIPIESFELGTPCIIGNSYKYFSGTALEDCVVVKDVNNIYEIYEKIKYIAENKEEVMSKYYEWRAEHINTSQQLMDNFLRK